MKSTRSLNRIIIIFALLIAGHALTAKVSAFDNLPVDYDGSMMPYNFTANDTIVLGGDTLKPVFVSYVARHGARYLSSPDKVSHLKTLLTEQAAKGNLTPAGIDFMERMIQIDTLSAVKWGRLSPLGIYEEQRLGSQMSHFLPQLLKQGKIRAISTSKPRVVLSMYQFLHALEQANTQLVLSTLSGGSADDLLRCFDSNPDYKSYRATITRSDAYRNFFNIHVPQSPAMRLFVNPDFDFDARTTTMNMYEVMQAFESSGLPAPTTEWMSPEEYRSCWLTENLEHYLRNSVNNISDIAAIASRPLLHKIIDDADNALEHPAISPRQQLKMNAYFGHAETLMPLFALMKLPGCYAVTDNYDNLDTQWQVENITPLGANLAVIFLKGSDGLYTLIRLNGQYIPYRDGAPLIVSWPTLRSYWQQLL
ncbi:MAG: histidine phosphatase family protein [Paramuribaculum sp.]|nr:histidine phosphatase family protein [Paramuribaculum sp.]MDE6304728.1 histidine phosphatase family protein [Paramuribaculum sp.]